jgi:hypothetical protein
VISSYQAAIGRVGGSKSSPAKKAAARAAAFKRWGRETATLLPIDDLTDGTWYSGKGRNADMGLWDARNRCFWVTCIVDHVDPMAYPLPGSRAVRMKRERHTDDKGTFQPRKPVS